TGPSAKKLINSVSDKAKKGNNSDITSLTGLTTPLSVAQGGTGGATPADAANNIGLGQKSSPFFSQLNISTTGYAIIGVQNTSRGATDVGARVSIEASVAANSRGSIIQKNNQNTPENQIESLLPSSPGVLAVQGTSGREYKKDIEDADTCEAMRRIMGLRMVNFVYKDDELARVRFGIIAEEAEDVAPQYVKHNQFPVPGSQVYNEEGQLVNQQYADRPSI
ncbi:tail fiber domain-containing protein, partial [Salmonella enterica]|nr:tail fiber domain-containing protein [Salmonella enterica subsp. enterica serovar Orion]EHK2732544.1 tail fiber domain-containing protein [Salmonella enterica]